MPQILKDAMMQRLTIAMAGIQVLRAGGLKIYANSLQDMYDFSHIHTNIVGLQFILHLQ
jgi:hypothetical protein